MLWEQDIILREEDNIFSSMALISHRTSTFEWRKEYILYKVLPLLIHTILYDYGQYIVFKSDINRDHIVKTLVHCVILQDGSQFVSSYKRCIYQNQYNTIVVFLIYFIHGNALVLGYFRYLNYMRVIAFCKLTLLVPISLVVRCTRYNIMWYSLSVICDRSVVFHRVLRFPPPIKLTATV